MPPDRRHPGSPEDWLDRAKSSLALAKQTKPEEAFWEDQCFLAQQAAEKAFKAVYQHKGIPFRYVHDLEELGKTLEDAGIILPDVVKESVVLSRYATQTRYPGIYEPVDEEEYMQAVAMAEAVVQWQKKLSRLVREKDEENRSFSATMQEVQGRSQSTTKPYIKLLALLMGY